MKARPEDTRAWVRAVVRSGIDSSNELTHRVTEAIRADHPKLDADAWAARWMAEAVRDWHADAEQWPETTDYDRLQRAFSVLQESGIVVLQGCTDHWAARDVAQAHRPVGVAWFTEPDIWHAIDEGMLELNLWHGTTANAAPGDELLDRVISVLADAGLEAHFDEGRIEVAAYWQCPPPG